MLGKKHSRLHNWLPSERKAPGRPDLIELPLVEDWLTVWARRMHAFAEVRALHGAQRQQLLLAAIPSRVVDALVKNIGSPCDCDSRLEIISCNHSHIDASLVARLNCSRHLCLHK